MKEKCMKGQIAYCPDSTCKKRTNGGKGGLVKPDIVFFGEGLPDRFFHQLSDLKKADLLITLGTSLQVQPFASLIDRVNSTCPRLLINLERVGDIGGEDYLDDGNGYSPDAADGYSGGGGRGMFSMFRETGFDFFGRGVKDRSRIRDVFYKGKTDEGVKLLAKTCGWEDELVRLFEDESKKYGKGAGSDGALTEAKQEAERVAEEVSEKHEESAAVASSNKEKPATGTDDLAEQVEKLSVADKAQKDDDESRPSETSDAKTGSKSNI